MRFQQIGILHKLQRQDARLPFRLGWAGVALTRILLWYYYCLNSRNLFEFQSSESINSAQKCIWHSSKKLHPEAGPETTKLSKRYMVTRSRLFSQSRIVEFLVEAVRKFSLSALRYPNLVSLNIRGLTTVASLSIIDMVYCAPTICCTLLSAYVTLPTPPPHWTRVAVKQSEIDSSPLELKALARHTKVCFFISPVDWQRGKVTCIPGC